MLLIFATGISKLAAGRWFGDRDADGSRPGKQLQLQEVATLSAKLRRWSEPAS